LNIAVIFAGGTGTRMSIKTVPKQFLELHGKPIIIYTLEKFDQHEEIDGIIVVCLESWIPKMNSLLSRFAIQKVKSVVPGGSSGMESIFNGLSAAKALYGDDTFVLIHDGVRPLIDHESITKVIRCAEENGNSVTVVPAKETIAIIDGEGKMGEILDRKKCWLARAPQCFRLGEIFEAHLDAQKAGRNDFVDSADLMKWKGAELFPCEGKSENIKITTADDYYFFKALIEVQEYANLFGK